MKILGSRVQLSPFEQSDLALFIEISTCPIMMTDVYDPMTRDEAIAAFKIKSQPWNRESDQWLSFSITEISTGEKIGSIGLKIVDHQQKIAEVGFMITPSAQGKGYGAEALTLIKAHAFNDLNFNKLIAICAVANRGSAALLEKSAFKRQELLTNNTLINNQYVDDFLYGCSKPD